MMKRVFALLALCVVLSACESPANDNETTAGPKPSPTVQPPPAVVASPSPETSMSVNALKPGDKVKAANGSFTDATVVSVDEKASKATIRLAGQTTEKTVSLSEIIKQ
jgi:hypothetical protein